jgi:hypothetical protein
MTPDPVLYELLLRLRANHDEPVILGWDEVRRWPPGVLDTLTQDGLLSEAAPANSLECEGCEEHCWMPVHVFPAERGRPARAFIACDYREDIGRVPVDLNRRRRWQATPDRLVRWLYRCQNPPLFTEEAICDHLWQLPLDRLVTIRKNHLLVDTSTLRELLAERDSPSTDSRCNRFVLTGHHWTVTFQGKTRTLNKTRGVQYIEYLIRRTGQRIHVSELFYAFNPPDHEAVNQTYSAMSAEELEAENLQVGDLGDAGEAMTLEGKQRLQRYLEQLAELIEDARERGDEDKQAALEEEEEKVLQRLAADFGLSGKPRRSESLVEKLRKNVSKRIAADIKKIRSVFPELGTHLASSIKTGIFCQYSPPPDIYWDFQHP